MKTLTPTETAAFQSMLNRTGGAGLNQDGDWGPKTQAAFEKWAGLSSKSAPAKPSAPEILDNPAVGTGEFDERSERLLATLIPGVQPTFRKLLKLALARASDFGCSAKVISGNRTYAEQDDLYAQGRTKPGRPVTNARGGYSNHNFAIAVDLGIFAGGSYLDKTEPVKAERVHRAIAEAIKASGLPVEWGGDWKSFPDIPHWEYRTGLTMTEKRALVAAGKSLV